MPKVTEAHLEARREQILDASRRCFAQDGFHQTTMQDICDEAGLSPGAVYRYFDSKEAIIEACAELCQERVTVIAHDAMSKNDPLSALDELSDHLLELDLPEGREDTRINIQIWAEAMRSPRVMNAFRRMGHGTFQVALTDMISGAQRSGAFTKSLRPEAVAQALLSLWHGLQLQKGIDPDLNVEDYLAVVKSLIAGIFQLGDGHAAVEEEQE